MKARFHGGSLGGRPFTIAGMAPPRGLDVAHDDQVLRYGFERVEGGEAVYRFAGERQRLSRSSQTITLGEAFNAVPLPYVPKPKG